MMETEITRSCRRAIAAFEQELGAFITSHAPDSLEARAGRLQLGLMAPVFLAIAAEKERDTPPEDILSDVLAQAFGSVFASVCATLGGEHLKHDGLRLLLVRISMIATAGLNGAHESRVEVPMGDIGHA